MGFDRSRLKATPLNKLKSQEELNKSKRPKGNFNADYHKIEDGDNIFRIFPPHPEELGGGETYSEPKTVTFLEVTKQKRDDNGKPIDGEFEVKRAPIFHAKVHGNLENDPVDAYIDFMKNRVLPDNFDGDITELKKEVTNGKFGVKPSDGWVMWAAKKGKDGSLGNLALLEVKPSVATQMTEIAAEFAGEDVQSPDPFTDIDEGICVVINKSGKDLNTEYKVSLEKKKKDKLNWELVPTPIPDDLGEIFMSKDPLKKMYVGVYKRSDFELAVEGLKNFDTKFSKKHGINGAFAYDEFLDILAEIDAVIPEETKQESKKSEAKSAPAKVGPAKKTTAAPAAPAAKAAPVKAAPAKKAPVAPALPEIEEEQEESGEDYGGLDETFAQEPGLVQKQQQAQKIAPAKVTPAKKVVPKAAPAPVQEEEQQEEAEQEVVSAAPAANRLAEFRKKMGR
jgi:hypothetical protein